jgi:hypothetical protein
MPRNHDWMQTRVMEQMFRGCVIVPQLILSSFKFVQLKLPGVRDRNPHFRCPLEVSDLYFAHSWRKLIYRCQHPSNIPGIFNNSPDWSEVVLCISPNTMALLSFPDDILSGVLQCLLPSFTDISVYPDTYSDPDGEWVTSRRALFALSLTCRRLSNIATPYLYRKIFIWNGTAMVFLMRSLLASTVLREHIRVLAITQEIDYEDDFAEPFESISWNPDSMAPFERSIFNFCYCDDDSGDDSSVEEGFCSCVDNIGEAVLASLICLAPRLHTFHINIPGWNVSDYSHLEGLLDDVFQDETLRSRVLSSLSKVRIATDSGLDSPRLQMGLVKPLLRLSDVGVRELELFGDCFEDILPLGGNNVSQVADSALIWRHVEKINVQSSFTLGRAWYHLCDVCPELKEIHICLSAFLDGGDSNFGEQSFSHALLRRAGTLQRLEILSFGYLGELGPDPWLSCLPQLPKLTILDIELDLLYEDRNQMAVRDIRMILPPSLSQLTIREEWDRGDEDTNFNTGEKRIAYGSKMGQTLKNLVLYSRPRLPELKTVIFLQTWDHWRIGFGELLDVPLEGGQVAFIVKNYNGSPIDLYSNRI